MLHLFDGFRALGLGTVLIKLLVACLCGTLIGLERSSKNRPAGFRTHTLVCLAAAAAALVLGFLAVKLVQWAYNAAVIAARRPELAVNRGYSMEGDISNRRMDVWKSGLQIGLSRPLTGVSFAGAVPYAREHLPDIYILTNDLWVFNTFDSELVNVFAAQGVPGLAILLVWAALAVEFAALDPVQLWSSVTSPHTHESSPRSLRSTL